MSVLARVRSLTGDRDWVRSLLSFGAVIGLGILAGQQYMEPDKRVLAVAAAVVLFGVAWRLDLVSGVGILVLAIPFPRYTVFGSTNLAFILLLMVVWLLRYTAGEAPAPRRTPMDAPVGLLVLAYILSFYNIDNSHHLQRATVNTLLFFGSVLMYYLISQNLRSEHHLRRFHTFQVISIGMLYAFCLWELAFPGHELIPGWIDLRGINVALFQVRNYRVGGPWLDYELLSEFAAMNMIFFVFLIAQARSMSRRVVFVIMLMVSVLILFSTVTRGGLFALAAGLAYMLYVIRRRVQIVPLTIIGGLSLVVFVGLNWYVSNFTVAGDILSRIGATRLVNGIPDSRAEVWPQAIERMMQHPFIGSGPYYSPERGLHVWYWPHNLILYIGNIVGLFGLGAFLWVIWTMWKISKPQTDRLNDPSYLKAFQLCSHVMLVVFLVDEMKIEYLRNPNYQFQPWILFGAMVATFMIRSEQTAASPAPVVQPARPPAPRALPSGNPARP